MSKMIYTPTKTKQANTAVDEDVRDLHKVYYYSLGYFYTYVVSAYINYTRPIGGIIRGH